jgi:hypothetical protein
MLYLAIDQHRKQLTVNLRNDQGDVLLRRQVSTAWPRVRQLFEGNFRNAACRKEDLSRSWRSADSTIGC